VNDQKMIEKIKLNGENILQFIQLGAIAVGHQQAMGVGVRNRVQNNRQ